MLTGSKVPSHWEAPYHSDAVYRLLNSRRVQKSFHRQVWASFQEFRHPLDAKDDNYQVYRSVAHLPDLSPRSTTVLILSASRARASNAVRLDCD